MTICFQITKLKLTKDKTKTMLKKIFLLAFITLSFLLVPTAKQIVFANEVPEQVRVIYSFTYIYSADELVLETTEKEQREEYVLEIASLHQVYLVVEQTEKMYKIEFEKQNETLAGYIYKSVVIDNKTKSPTKYLQTNATITKDAEVFKKEENTFVKVENILLEKNTKARLLEKLTSANEYTLISFTSNNTIEYAYVKTNHIKADGMSRSVLVAITLILTSISVGSVLLTIFKRNNKKKKQSLLNSI